MRSEFYPLLNRECATYQGWTRLMRKQPVHQRPAADFVTLAPSAALEIAMQLITCVRLQKLNMIGYDMSFPMADLAQLYHIHSDQVLSFRTYKCRLAYTMLHDHGDSQWLTAPDRHS
jgi:hypothetical protein